MVLPPVTAREPTTSSLLPVVKAEVEQSITCSLLFEVQDQRNRLLAVAGPDSVVHVFHGRMMLVLLLQSPPPPLLAGVRATREENVDVGVDG